MTEPGGGGLRLSDLELVARRHQQGVERYGDAALVDITHDSRQVRDGAAFVALPGSHLDGHRFAAEAVRRGAAALVVSRFLEIDVPQLRVPATRAAVGPLAAAVHGFPSRRLRIVGITGTNGKTTAAYLVEAALTESDIRTGLIGTIEAGLPGAFSPAVLTTPEATDLQRLLADIRSQGGSAVALEVSSHALDQERVAGTHFEVALFTNLEPEHLDYHGTIEHYWASKAKLFTPAYSRRALICVDDPWGRRLAAQCQLPTVTFGATGSGADVTYQAVGQGLDGLTVVVAGAMGDAVVRSQLVGPYTAASLVGAYLAAVTLGADPVLAAEGIAACPRPSGRFELVERDQPFLVVVDYAHTPGSLRSLVLTARQLIAPGGQVSVIVGARGGRDRYKRPATAQAAAQADRVFLTTDNPGDEDPSDILRQVQVGLLGAPAGSVQVEPDRRTAIHAAIAKAGEGDAVLIAGRGHETTIRLAGATRSIDDRVVAAEALDARYGRATA